MTFKTDFYSKFKLFLVTVHIENIGNCLCVHTLFMLSVSMADLCFITYSGRAY